MTDQHDTDFNARQWRIIDFAVRKSGRWTRAEFDPKVAVITRPGSDRQMVLYRSGRTGTGVRVAIIDPSLPANEGLKFVTQREAWTMLAEGLL